MKKQPRKWHDEHERKTLVKVSSIMTLYFIILLLNQLHPNNPSQLLNQRNQHRKLLLLFQHHHHLLFLLNQSKNQFQFEFHPQFAKIRLKCTPHSISITITSSPRVQQASMLYSTMMTMMSIRVTHLHDHRVFNSKHHILNHPVIITIIFRLHNKQFAMITIHWPHRNQKPNLRQCISQRPFNGVALFFRRIANFYVNQFMFSVKVIISLVIYPNN